MIRAERVHQRSKLMRREHDRVDINSFEITCRRLWQPAVTIGTRAPGMIDPAGISTEVAAAMDGEDFEPRMALKNAIKNQIMQRDRRLQRITDDVVKIKPRQPRGFGEAVGMDHHQNAELFGFSPEWRESLI